MKENSDLELITYMKSIDSDKELLEKEYRSNAETNKNDDLLATRREIYSERKKRGEIKYSNIAKTFYLSQKYRGKNMGRYDHLLNDVLYFINSCGSKCPKIKHLGYIGTTINLHPNEKEYSILMINTLKKDIMMENGIFSRRLALGFLANLNLESLDAKFRSVYSYEFKKLICLKNREQNFYGYIMLAYYKFNALDDDICISYRNYDHLGLKLQLILDFFYMKNHQAHTKTYINEKNESNKYILSENDILYLKKCFVLNTNNYVLIKILQLFRFMREKNNLNEPNSYGYKLNSFNVDFGIPFYNAVEKKIENTPKTSIIALSLECSEFLISCNYKSSKAHSFVFKLIEQSNAYLQCIAFKIVRKYNIFKDIVLKKIFGSGIKTNNHLKILNDSLLTSRNTAYIYENRELIFFSMNEAGVPEEEIKMKWESVLIKMLENSNFTFNKILIKENPRIVLKLEKDLIFYLGKDNVQDIFYKYLESESIDDFLLFYKAFDCMKDDDVSQDINLQSIFTNHLNKIVDCYVMGGICNLKEYISPLTSLMIKFENFIFNYSTFHFKSVQLNEYLKQQTEIDHKIIEMANIFDFYKAFFQIFDERRVVDIDLEEIKLSLIFFYKVEFFSDKFRKLVNLNLTHNTNNSETKNLIEIIDSESCSVIEFNKDRNGNMNYVLECIDFECDKIEISIQTYGKIFSKIIEI